MRLLPGAVLCLLLILDRDATAQTKPQFEVASIKPSSPDARGTFIRPGPGGGISIANMTLKELIVLAWRVQPFQITGGPAWLSTDRYDVTGKPAAKPSPGEINLMLQALFEDRFRLAVRQETKEMSIYALVLARKDGKLGPGLKESKEGGCTNYDSSDPRPAPQPGKRPALGCGGLMAGGLWLNAVAVPIASLILPLSERVERQVVDKTGLMGKFDINLEWTPDETQAPPPPGTLPLSSGAPSFYTAQQEQLGLKLESQKGAVDILMIERAEKLSEN
jgi:uncharacterized protein (TIGR03435 family)